MRFSQRDGYTPAQKAIQLDSMDDQLRAGLWDAVQFFLWDRTTATYTTRGASIYSQIETVWHDYFKQPVATISKDQADALANLWCQGNGLHEQRVQEDLELNHWLHQLTAWTSEVILRVQAIDPAEAFAFESIGFQHRHNQNRNLAAQHDAARAQLGDRLEEFRRITGRYLGQGA